MEFMGPPDSWYNAPDIHEVCCCEECHNEGEHDSDTQWWARRAGCLGCIDELLEEIASDPSRNMSNSESREIH